MLVELTKISRSILASVVRPNDLDFVTCAVVLDHISGLVLGLEGVGMRVSRMTINKYDDILVTGN